MKKKSTLKKFIFLKWNNKIHYFVILLLITFNSYAQDNSLTRQIIPQSPNVSSLLKFDQHPVSIATGLPEITIPIYNVSGKNISLPISLRYHSGGIKLTDVASWVGMGWSLDYGGVITQTVKGLPDTESGNNGIGRLNSPAWDQTDPSICDLSALAENLKDLEPDIFNFSFNGKSGSFYFDDNKKIVQIPEQKLKIEVLPGEVPGSGFNIFSFQITDLDGVKYIFSGNEQVYVRSVSLRNQELVANDIRARTQNSFYLTSIIDINNEVINFTYDNYAIKDIIYNSDTQNILGNSTAALSCEIPVQTTALTRNFQTQLINAYRIKSITFKNGRIDFIAGANRCDLYGEKVLDRIAVYGPDDNKLKEFKLNYKYFVGSNILNLNELVFDPNEIPDAFGPSFADVNTYKNKRLFLTGVDEINVINNEINGRYGMEYINTIGLPDRFSAQQDWWGFFNGNGLSSPLDGIFRDPNNGIYSSKYTTTYRNPSLLHSVQGILNKITYPTGGYAEFDFEQNTTKVSNVSSPDQIIHQPVTYNVPASQPDHFLGNLVINDGANGLKEIKFEVQNCVFGPNTLTIPRFVIKDNNNNVIVSDQDVASAPYVNNGNSRTITLNLNNGSYQIFSYAMGLPCNYFIKILTWYEYPPINWINPAGGVRVNKSTLYDPQTNSKLIKKYSYNKLENGVLTSTGKLSLGMFSVGYRYLQSVCISTFPPAEKATEVYVLSSKPNYQLGNVIYDQVTEKNVDDIGNDIGYSEYTYMNMGDEISSAFLTKDYQGFLTTVDDYGAPFFNIYDYSWMRNKLIKKEDFMNIGGQYKRVSRMQNYYKPIYTDTLQGLSTSYYLNSQFPGVTCPSGFTVGRNTKIMYSKYPIYSGYLSIDSTLTEDTDQLNQVIERTKRFEYSQATLLPSKIEEKSSLNGRYYVKIFKYSGDYTGIGSSLYGIFNLQQKNVLGAVIEQSNYVADSNNKLISSSFTSYKTDLPVPESVSKIEISVPITNFNNSYVASGTVLRDNRYTRFVNFDRYDNVQNLLEQHLENMPHISYLYSYNSQYPIAEIKNADYATIESILGGSAAVSSFAASNPTDAAVNTLINTLRNSALLKDAQITSYTYKPLVGMTSSTDAKGMTTYYEYDAFQRLKTVKDQNGNILKQTDYHYKN